MTTVARTDPRPAGRRRRGHDALRARLFWRVLARLVAGVVSLLFVYPYLWMLSGAFRSTRDILSAPLHLWPEHFDLSGFSAIADVGGVSLLRCLVNSVAITVASTALAVAVAALGAYAIRRRPAALAFRLLRGGFLLSMMYPYMLLVIPVYLVMYHLGLLGGYLGIVLFLALGPIQFFLFEQFFRTIPEAMIEAAAVDGANEFQVLWLHHPADGTRGSGDGGGHHLPAQLGAVVPGDGDLGLAGHVHAAGGAAEPEWRAGNEFPGYHGIGGDHHRSAGVVVPAGAASGDGRHDRGSDQGVSTADTTLQARIAAARAATLAWLDAMQTEGLPRGVARISAAHDPAAWPGVLLPGTYNGVLCRYLLDAMGDIPAAPLIAWLELHRRENGVFRMPGMRDDAVFKKPDPVETWRYIDFHVTNYTLGAIEALDPARPPVLIFARPFLDPLTHKAWLAERDLRDPWQEGNNIVNLGSFFLLLRRFGLADTAAVDQAMAILFAWHERLQEPSTGFWGVGQSSDPRAALHAMAGSMHNFHLWYATARKLPYQDKAVDYALAQPTGIDSACIDLDLVDLLVHGHMLIDHRRGETITWLRAKLLALLDFQNADGGFADERAGIRHQDGWVRGYAEPQGLPNTFATWFRWIAIAMIADLLWPGWRRWHFRRMVGIGYRLERAA